MVVVFVAFVAFVGGRGAQASLALFPAVHVLQPLPGAGVDRTAVAIVAAAWALRSI